MIGIVGAPPNNELDRELESPIDDAWSTDADEPVAAAADADRTTIGTGEEAIAPWPTMVSSTIKPSASA